MKNFMILATILITETSCLAMHDENFELTQTSTASSVASKPLYKPELEMLTEERKQSITSLDYSQYYIDGKDLTSLIAAGLPNLQHLNIGGWNMITETDILSLASFTKLKKLHLPSRIGRRCIEQLKVRLPNVTITQDGF